MLGASPAEDRATAAVGTRHAVPRKVGRYNSRAMLSRRTGVLLLAVGLGGCLRYEYEHEFWLRVDGSGAVNVTGRPALWTAFKGLGRPRDPEATAAREAVRALFERSGLRVRRVTLTSRGGHPYLFVSAEFDDLNALNGAPAFPDLKIGLRREPDRLVLEGTWARPKDAPEAGGRERDGLMAVRFHLPSKVYGHRNATEGVERGNIVGWRQEVAQALDGRALDFGAEMDDRSILLSTVLLFASAVALAVLLLAGGLWAAARRGRREL
jgi:hypothetical protein